MAAQTLNARYEILETLPDADTLPFTVARARDIAQERAVTLQTLPARRIGVLARRLAFSAAVQQAVRLDHPNITRVHDQGETDGGDLYVVTEYMRGITLKERIRRIAPFSLAVAADIAVAIAEALEHAHGLGVTHGDLRPHHVLLSPEGQIKVGDFAYGRAAALLTGDGPDPLYAAYVAPELGSVAVGTVAGDVYALGATLYEMLTGALPPAEGEGPPSPRPLNPGVPPALEGVVQKALHPNPAARYRSVTPLLADLRAVREALRAGRSLAWSPVAERRVPRPPSPAPVPERRPEPAAARTQVVQPLPPLDEDERDAPVRAASRALSITLAVLFVVAVLGVLGLSWYATRFLAIPDDIVVPSLIGKTFDQAQQVAAQQHFNLVEQDPDTPHYSTQWPENQIFQQQPPAGDTIKAGRDVTVLRSAGPPLLQVPDLSGMTQARALSALQSANLPLGTVTEDYSDTVPQGIVSSQQPVKSAMVARQTPVNFVVSRGKQPPDVPEGVTAEASDSATIVLNWDRVAHADSYTVSRAQGQDVRTVATNVPATQTEITDSGLTPDTTYIYTVTAVNAGGSSGPSDPVTAVTPPLAPAAPTLPQTVSPPDGGSGPDTGNGPDTGGGTAPTPAPPDGGTSANPPDAGSPRLRQFTIQFIVPHHPDRDRHVQFEIQDALGLSWPFDEWRSPGTEVDSPVQAFGNRVTFRIFLDGKMAKQQTL